MSVPRTVAEVISQDCAVGEDAFRQLNEPVVVQQQRASALRFADQAVQALSCWSFVCCPGVFPTATCAITGRRFSAALPRA